MKVKAFVIYTAMILFFSGCSNQGFENTGSGVSDVFDTGRPYVELKEERLALEKSQKLAKALAVWKATNPEKAAEYHIGPDDVLKIEVLSLEEPGRMSSLLRTVNKDGTINLIYGGTVMVGGLSVTDAQAAVRDALAQKIIKDPQVTVSIEQYKSASVVLTGALTKPGVYYLNRDVRSLLEMMAEADGLSGAAGDELFIVRGTASVQSQKEEGRKEDLVVVDLKKLLDQGDVRLNLWVRGGDIITVQPRTKQYIYVLGYVNHPGMYEFDETKSLDAVRAVALAGGLASSARAENSFLLRRSVAGQKMIPIDLTKTIRGTKPPVMLESGDTLVVGSSVVAKLAEFIKPSMSAGASYTPK